MIQIKNQFIYNPGGENEGSAKPNDSQAKKDGEEEVIKPNDEKTVVDKIKDALQDWSNDDKRETDFDDTYPVT